MKARGLPRFVRKAAGIGHSTYFAWKKKYGGLLPDEMRRLKQLEDENSRLKRIVADETWIGRCCRMLSGESSEAGTDARTGCWDVPRLSRRDPQGVWGPEFRLLELPLQIPPQQSGRTETTDPGDLRDAHALRLPPRLRRPRPGSLGGQHQDGLKCLQSVRFVAAEQDAEAAGEGQAAR